jgi:hypothetical protein
MSQVEAAPATATALGELMELWKADDPWAYDHAYARGTQMAALQEQIALRRTEMELLDRLASELGVGSIRTLEDVVPLLFADTLYKSYPRAFLEHGEWQRMTRWLEALSSRSLEDVDLTGVGGTADWVASLRAGGHVVVTSSGTSGKESFLNHTSSDREHLARCMTSGGRVIGAPSPEPIHPVFAGYPRAGRRMGEEMIRIFTEIYGKPDDIHFLTEGYVPIGELIELANVRLLLNEGTAPFTSIVAAGLSERQLAMEQKLDEWVADILVRRHEPIIISGPPAMIWQVIDRGRKWGVPDGDFHPDTFIRTGGGLKGFRSPADLNQMIDEFFGPRRSPRASGYGMTELMSSFQGCSAGACHASPTTIVLLLDKTGEKLLNQASGTAEGRGAFVDLAMQGRWGGLIGGDHMSVNFDPCSCGRTSPSLFDIARYKDLPEGDQELTRAGQIENHLRQLTGGDWIS